LCHCGGDAALKSKCRKLEREGCEENEEWFHTQTEGAFVYGMLNL
jgi:hypothetical protein